jgi:hypothetical protein
MGVFAFLHDLGIRPMRRRCCCLAAAVVAVWAGMAIGAAAEPSGLPDLVRTKHRTFAIPFRLPKSQDPDATAAAERVVLHVSKDLGGSWDPAGETAPSNGSFTYTADVDGEYWFRLRAIDRKGRARGGEGPDMRVLVDAAGPRLTARVWKGADGEIVCRYAAVDDSISIESLKVEYRGPGSQGWKTVAAEGILARESPAHLVGEEIWWAGEKVDSLAVKISVTDSSGNQTVKQFTLEPNDPRIDQAALATELGVPPLPAQSEPAAVATTTEPPASAHVAPAATPRGNGWTQETASWSPDGRQPQASSNGPSRGHSVLVNRSAEAPLTGVGYRGSPQAQAWRSDAAPQPDLRGVSGAIGGGLEYRGKPLHLSRFRRFQWDYEAPAPTASAAPFVAELWSTRDGGVTWQRSAIDDDGRSPIQVELPAAGLYGFRLELTSGGTGGPRSGDAPESWVGIDEEPPHVELIDVASDGAGEQTTLVIRYAARDPLLAPNGTRILYSPNPDGPWATIAAGRDNQGEHRWQPDRSVPARVFIRVEVTDAAGNQGAATTSDAIAVAQSKFTGRLGGLRPAPPPGQ